MSQREIEMGAALGRVHAGGREETKLADVEPAVGAALLMGSFSRIAKALSI